MSYLHKDNYDQSRFLSDLKYLLARRRMCPVDRNLLANRRKELTGGGRLEMGLLLLRTARLGGCDR